MTDGAPVRPASRAERDALQRTFADLCALRSPSGDERAVTDHVIAGLGRLGLTVVEDDAPTTIGGNAGNLLCRVPAAGSDPDGRQLFAVPETGSVLFCAHLDTVPVGPVVRPTLTDGVWRDGHGGVLGADNKATVAGMLALAARLVRDPVPLTVELLFTVQEEPQLRGSTAFDVTRLRSDCGYVVDHPSPLGGIVTAAPGHVRFDARYRGRAAHAAIAPDAGRSAIRAAARAIGALPAGRLPDGATVNVGHVDGGTAPGEPAVTNVVPAYARILGEVRGPDAAGLQATVDAVEAILHDAAHDPDGPVDLDLSLETRFGPYAHRATAVPLVRAAAAMAAVGLVPRPFVDAGGSDANVLNARGIPTVNLAGGNERAHEPGEAIPAAALDATLALLLAIVGEHLRHQTVA